MKIMVVILQVLLMLFLFAGCLSGIEADNGSISIENGDIEVQGDESGDGDAAVTFEEDTMKITEEDTSQGNHSADENNLEIDLEGDLNLPAGYPSEVIPLYEPTRVGLTNKFDTPGGGIGFEVQYQSNAEVNEVHEFYVGLLEENEFFTDMEMSPTYATGGVKGGYAVTLIITPSANDPDMTSVTIGLEETSMQ